MQELIYTAVSDNIYFVVCFLSICTYTERTFRCKWHNALNPCNNFLISVYNWFNQQKLRFILF